jgi:hypothetical protein
MLLFMSAFSDKGGERMKKTKHVYVAIDSSMNIEVYATVKGVSDALGIPYNTIRYNLAKEKPYQFIINDILYTLNRTVLIG